MSEPHYCGFTRDGAKCGEPAVAYIADPYPDGWACWACLEHKAVMVNGYRWIVLDLVKDDAPA